MNFQRRVKGNQDVSFQMAPMIDMVFLLLVFFMVATTFHKLSEEEVKLPLAEDSETKKGSFNELVVNVTKEGKIVFQQETYENAEKLGYILKKSLEQKKRPKLVIRGDKDAYYKWIMEAMKACAVAGVWDVSIATYQEEAKARLGEKK